MRKIYIFFPLLIFLILFPFFKKPAFALTVNNDRVIVKFYPYVSEDMRDKFLKIYPVEKTEKLKLTDTFVLKVPKNQRDNLLNKFIRNSLVEYAEPDFVAEAMDVPNDPLYVNQWALPKIKADYAWNTSHGSENAVIAVVDTGVDGTHPDILGKVVSAFDCTVSSPCAPSDPVDENGHGTHVAGIAGAATNNSIGIAGASYNSKLLSVKVLDKNGSGYYSWVSNGIIQAADSGAKVINLSLGGSSASTTLKNAVNYAWNKGSVVVAAAGNSGKKSRLYPAYYPNAIAVAATDQNDKKASFSNYGLWVDVAAPGVSILSTYKGDYSYLSGTSMAAPFVAGLAGLVAGYHPDWQASQIRGKIEQSADKISGTGKFWTYGRINACKSLDCVISSETPGAPILTTTPVPTVTSSPTNTPTPTVTPVPGTTGPTPTPWWCQRFPSLCR